MKQQIRQKISSSQYKIVRVTKQIDSSNKIKEKKVFCMIALKLQRLEDYHLEAQKRKVHMEMQSINIVKILSMQMFQKDLLIFQEPFLQTLENQDVQRLRYSQKLMIFEGLAQFVRENHVQCRGNLGIRPSNVVLKRDQKKIIPQIILLDQTVQFDPKKPSNYPSLKKPNNCAPQIAYRNIFCQSSDIWSLGCLFYFLLFGTTYGIKATRTQVILEFPPQTPGWMRNILTRMLSFDHSQRYTILEVLDLIKYMKRTSEAAEKYMPKCF